MTLKQLAAIAASFAVAAPAFAFDVRDAGTTTMFYVSIPLDSSLSRKQREMSYGMQLQGKNEYQSVGIDSKMLSFLPAGGIGAKWILAGAVAAGAAAAVAGKSKSTTSSLQAQQTQHQQVVEAQKGAEVPCDVVDPCKK